MTSDLTVLTPISLTDHLGVWENAKNKGASAYTLDAIPFASIEDVKAFADKAKAAKAAKKNASDASASAQQSAWSALVGLANSALGRAEVLKLAAEQTTTKQGKVQGIGAAGALARLGFEGMASAWSNLMAARQAGLALVKDGKTLAKSALEQALKAYNEATDAAKIASEQAAEAALLAKEEEARFLKDGIPTSAMIAEAEAKKAEAEGKIKTLAQALDLIKVKDDVVLPFLAQFMAALAEADAEAVKAAQPAKVKVAV